MHNNLLLAQPSDEKLYVEDVFSTWLYNGGSAQSINNGVDLSGKGGLVWLKGRSIAASNFLYDTANGGTSYLSSNTTGALANTGQTVVSFGSSGFSFPFGNVSGENSSGATYASWTFRKAPKFFDVVTYTGDGASTRDIAHSLGVAPGMIIVKNTGAASNWFVWHRSIDNNIIFLEQTAAAVASTGYYFGNSSTQTASNFRILSAGGTNANGSTYVAYLFAHDTTADGVIQCGSFTGNGSTIGPTINLGWEPQFLLVKSTTETSANWLMFDNMRGLPVSGNGQQLIANSSGAEGSADRFSVTPTGFNPINGYSQSNASGQTYIYLAIRRGPMRTPTDATKVYKSVTRTATNIIPWKASGAGFPPDMTIMSGRNLLNFSLSSASIYQHSVIDRLRRATEHIQLVNGDAEGGGWGSGHIHNQDGYDGLYSSDQSYWNASNDLYVDHHFRRSPGFFDIACYTGTGSTRTVTHSLGVAPELIIVKRRNAAGNWNVYCAALSSAASKYMIVNGTGAATTDTTYWSNISPTSSVFTVGSNAQTNTSGGTYVAYLFASCPGVSKIGTYTANGTSLNVDCGFTNGARFVLIKRADGTGAWTVFDTARGITTGNDPYLLLNPTAAAEVTSTDAIDPYPQGFTVNQLGTTNLNSGSATYIYLAIA